MATATKTHPKTTPHRSPSGRHQPMHSWRDEMTVRVLEFAAVWVMAFAALPIVGEIAHLVWSGRWAWIVLAVAFGAAAVLAVITYHEAAARSTFQRWRATVTVAVALASLGITTILGIVGHDPAAGWAHGWWVVQPWVNIYALAAFVICIAWNIPRTEAVRGAGDDSHGEGVGTIAEILRLPKRVHVVGTRTSDDDVSHEITFHHPGITAAELGHNIGNLVSEAGLPPTAARVVGDPEHADLTKVTLVLQDVLRDSEPWPGPSRPGGSITDPARVGRYEDGEDLEILRPGDPETGRPASSVIFMGMPNAGKTEAELVEVADDVTKVDVTLWWVDTAKGAQTAEDIRPAIDWLTTDKRNLPILAKAIRWQINYRAGALALLAKRYKAEGRQWTTAAWKHLRLPYLKVVFEEYADAGPILDQDIVAIGEQVRSTGISLHVSLQRATGDRVNTSLRSSLGMGACFGIKDASDANLALSVITLGMGANPGAWSNLKPGMCYLEATHVNQERWAMPARFFKPIPVAVLHWHIAWWAQLMAPAMPPDQAAAMPADVRAVYDKRQRCDLMEWVEGHGVDLLHPPKGTPLAAVEAVQNVAVPALAARGGKPITAPEPPAPETPTEPNPPERSTEPMTAAETEEMIADMDKAASIATARAATDPTLRRLIDAAEADAGQPTDPGGDPMALGDDLPEPTMTPNEALIDAFRAIFDRHPGADQIKTDTSELADLLAERGFYNDSNPRPFIIDRLGKLGPLAERGERGRGPIASTWIIRREVLTPPPPDTDGD